MTASEKSRLGTDTEDASGQRWESDWLVHYLYAEDSVEIIAVSAHTDGASVWVQLHKRLAESIGYSFEICSSCGMPILSKDTRCSHCPHPNRVVEVALSGGHMGIKDKWEAEIIRGPRSFWHSSKVFLLARFFGVAS